jgi:archaellum component FlaC
MTTEIGDIIFGTNSTLFRVLDTLDVPSISTQLASTNTRLDEVNDQLRQLGQIVDANQIANNTSFIAVNTQLDTLEADVLSLATEIEPLASQVDSLSTQVTSLSGEVSTLTTTVNSYNSRILTLENTTTVLSTLVTNISLDLNALSSRVGVLETNRVRQQLLTLGSEYLFTYRTGGVPGITYYYRLNYFGSQSTVIRAGIGHSAEVYDLQAGTVTTRTVYLAAPFDMFSSSGRYNYQMAQGPCVLSFTQNNTSPTTGYIITTQ